MAEPPKAPPPPPPDLRVVSRYTTGNTSTVSTTLFSRSRARIELGANLVSLQQCDTLQTTQLNLDTRTYLVTPVEREPTGAPAEPDDQGAEAGAGKAKPAARGGLVTMSTIVTDTGETSVLFGLTARRLKILTTRAASTDACDRTEQRVETDGWYVEAPETVSCLTMPQPARRLQHYADKDACVDEVRYERSGPDTGLPVRATTVSTIGSTAPVTTRMEVSELVRVDAASEQFEVPAGYLEVRSVRQLTADHRPGEPGARKPGVTRIGLAPIGNRSDARLAIPELGDALLETLSESEHDIIRLEGTTPAEIEADARRKDVDLVLQNTIADVKVPRGGVVGRLSGSANEAFTAKVEYALLAPGQSKPVHAGSERSGASTFSKAIMVTRKLVQFAPPVLMARYQYMNAYGSGLNQAGAGAGMGQAGDPVLNTAFALLDRAATRSAPETYSDEESAVAAALEKEVRSVLAELAKRKK